MPKTKPAPGPSADVGAILATADPLPGTAGAAGVRYAADFYGRPAVLFPIRDRDGGAVAATGRYIDGRADPKMWAAGPKSRGPSSTPGAFEADPLVITEAPIDAGVVRHELAGLRRVALATDGDAAGDAAAVKLGAVLSSFGAPVERWRPPAKERSPAGRPCPDAREALGRPGRARVTREF